MAKSETKENPLRFVRARKNKQPPQDYIHVIGNKDGVEKALALVKGLGRVAEETVCKLWSGEMEVKSGRAKRFGNLHKRVTHRYREIVREMLSQAEQQYLSESVDVVSEDGSQSWAKRKRDIQNTNGYLELARPVDSQTIEEGDNRPKEEAVWNLLTQVSALTGVDLLEKYRDISHWGWMGQEVKYLLSFALAMAWEVANPSLNYSPGTFFPDVRLANSKGGLVCQFDGVEVLSNPRPDLRESENARDFFRAALGLYTIVSIKMVTGDRFRSEGVLQKGALNYHVDGAKAQLARMNEELGWPRRASLPREIVVCYLRPEGGTVITRQKITSGFVGQWIQDLDVGGVNGEDSEVTKWASRLNSARKHLESEERQLNRGPRRRVNPRDFEGLRKTPLPF